MKIWLLHTCHVITKRLSARSLVEVLLCTLALQRVVRDATATQALTAVSQKVKDLNPRDGWEMFPPPQWMCL